MTHIDIAIENGHLESVFLVKIMIFHSYVTNYRRVMGMYSLVAVLHIRPSFIATFTVASTPHLEPWLLPSGKQRWKITVFNG